MNNRFISIKKPLDHFLLSFNQQNSDPTDLLYFFLKNKIICKFLSLSHLPISSALHIVCANLLNCKETRCTAM